MNALKFEAGKTYATRSICDSNQWVSVTVAKRTAKTITTPAGKVLRIGFDHNGHECVKPWGSFSMAPVVSAEDLGRGPEPVPVIKPRCDQGGTRHVFLGNARCTLCGAAASH